VNDVFPSAKKTYSFEYGDAAEKAIGKSEKNEAIERAFGFGQNRFPGLRLLPGLASRVSDTLSEDE
jgi:hypothetical protein